MWPEVLAGVALLLALVVVPGLVAAWSLGIRRLEAALLAPALGICLVLLAGAVAGALHVPWTPAVGALSTLALAAVPRLLTRRGRATAGDAASPREWAGAAVGGTVSAAVFTYVTIAAVRTPEAIPQQPDTVFHLGAGAWLSNHRSASFLDAGQFVWTGPSWYPGGFQSLSSTPTGWLGIPVTVASLAVLLVVGGVVVPAGLMLLVRAALGRGFLPLAIAGVMSTAFVAFPYSFMAAGVLWSNLLAQALVPFVLALLWLALRSGSSPLLPWVLSGGLLLAGVYAAQPNGLFSIGLLAYPMLVVGLAPWRAERRTRARSLWWGLAILSAPLAVLLTAVLPRASFLTNDLRDPPDLRYAVLVGLKVGEAPLLPGAGPLLVLVVVGAAWSLLERGRPSWIAWGLVLAVALYCVPSALPEATSRRVTWPWANDGVRLLALVAVPATVCVTAGAVALSRGLAVVLNRRGSWWAATLAVGLVLMLALASVPQRRDAVAATYHPREPGQWWVRPSEIEALRDLARSVPDDAVVAANPWRGGTYLYAIAGVRTAFPTEKQTTSERDLLLSSRLDVLETDHEVCDLVTEMGVRYVLTGGSAQRDATAEQIRDFRGVDQVGLRSAFAAVAKAGPYTLWRVPPCEGSGEGPAR